jgi:photosystem II stability/assembly factor-like uncharacterized protein
MNARLVLPLLLSVVAIAQPAGTFTRTGSTTPNEWTSVGPEGGQISSLSIDPHHPGTIYAATGEGHAFKSVNWGASWIASGVPNSVLIFDPQDANTIYAISGYPDLANDFGILKSTDSGASWMPANSGLPTYEPPYYIVSALAIDPQDPLLLYAGSISGIFKSTDGGTSWSAANSGLPIYPTPDGDTNPIDQNRYVAAYAILIDPRKTDTIYGIVDHSNAPGSSLYKSTDGGASWNPAGSGLPESRLTLAIDPKNSSTLFAATAYGVFKSTDGGAGWSLMNSGLPLFNAGPPPFPNGSPYFQVDSVAIDPQDPATVYATISDESAVSRVFKTTNGGASWSEAGSGLPGGTYFSVLTIDPHNPATLYAGTGTDPWNGKGAFESTDSGVSWTAANSGLTDMQINNLAVAPRNGTLYAATPGRLFKTTDRGVTWSAADSGLAFVSFAPAIDPQNANTLFVAASALDASGAYTPRIYKSMDGGANWIPILIPNLIPGKDFEINNIAVDPRNSNNVYATIEHTSDEPCSDGRLPKSTDGGMTWSESLFQDSGISSSCVLALVIDPQHPANLYTAFKYGGVFKSTDAGASWSPVNSGLTDAQGSSSAVALAIDPRDSNILYAVSSRGSNWGVFKSNDAGAGILPVPGCHSWTVAL